MLFVLPRDDFAQALQNLGWPPVTVYAVFRPGDALIATYGFAANELGQFDTNQMPTFKPHHKVRWILGGPFEALESGPLLTLASLAVRLENGELRRCVVAPLPVRGVPTPASDDIEDIFSIG